MKSPLHDRYRDPHHKPNPLIDVLTTMDRNVLVRKLRCEALEEAASCRSRHQTARTAMLLPLSDRSINGTLLQHSWPTKASAVRPDELRPRHANTSSSLNQAAANPTPLHSARAFARSYRTAGRSKHPSQPIPRSVSQRKLAFRRPSRLLRARQPDRKPRSAPMILDTSGPPLAMAVGEGLDMINQTFARWVALSTLLHGQISKRSNNRDPPFHFRPREKSPIENPRRFSVSTKSRLKVIHPIIGADFTIDHRIQCPEHCQMRDFARRCFPRSSEVAANGL